MHLRSRWQTLRHTLGKARRGQGVVEMALLMPLLALILVGAIDLGRVYIDAARMNNAVKEAAAIGLYQPDQTSINRRAWREVTDPTTNPPRLLLGPVGMAGDSNAQFRIYPITCLRNNVVVTCDGNPRPGDLLQVKGEYDFYPLTTMILKFFPNKLTISRTIKVVY